MITNNFNKELRGISDALRDLGYTDSTIGLRQRYWKEYCVYHGSLDIDESSMDKFLLVNYGIQREHQYFKTTVRGKGCAPLRNLLEYRRYGKIKSYHTPWFKQEKGAFVHGAGLRCGQYQWRSAGSGKYQCPRSIWNLRCFRYGYPACCCDFACGRDRREPDHRHRGQRFEKPRGWDHDADGY